jgi:hypothetical protein
MDRRVHTVVAQLITQLGSTLRVTAVAGRDDRPLLGEAATDRGPNPAGTAGHERDVAVKSGSAVVSGKARGGLTRAQDWGVAVDLHALVLL